MPEVSSGWEWGRGVTKVRCSEWDFRTGICIGKRWHVEATIGVGYVSLEYDEYVWKQCGRFLGHGRNSYLGPTKIGVSFSYTIM